MIVGTLQKKTRATLQPSSYTVELRQRVERLERQRTDVCMHRDRETVDFIDKQIKQAIAEWSESFVVEHQELLKNTA